MVNPMEQNPRVYIFGTALEYYDNLRALTRGEHKSRYFARQLGKLAPATKVNQLADVISKQLI